MGERTHTRGGWLAPGGRLAGGEFDPTANPGSTDGLGLRGANTTNQVPF
jgi:hypothetical protein